MNDLTVREVAAILRRDPETIRVRVRAGKFPNAYREGRDIRIPREDVEKLRTPTRKLRPEDKAMLDDLLGEEV